MIKYSGDGLSMLLDNKKLSDAERRKIILTSEALALIYRSLSTEGSSHKLSEEMDNLENYVAKIEASLTENV